MNPICPYCSQRSELVGGLEVYPHRPDLASKHFYLCRPCAAYVGCHPGGCLPLGRLADAELRTWKQRAHRAFDPLWKNGSMRRKEAYRWLSKVLGIPEDETHIGMFDVHQCKRVVEVVRKLEETRGLRR